MARPALRVLLDLTALLPTETGVDTYLLELVRHLPAADPETAYLALVNIEDRDRVRSLVPSSVRVVPGSARPRPARLTTQQIVIPLLTAARMVDVVHSPSFIMPQVRVGAGHVLTIHDMTSFTRPDDHIRLRRSLGYVTAVRRSIRRADVIIVPSEHTRRSILSHVEDVDATRIERVPYAVDVHFRPPTDCDVAATRARYGLPERYILSVGTLEPRKNLPMLVDAFADVVDRDPGSAELVLVGRQGWSNDALEQRLGRSAVAGRVHRLGYVPRDDLPALYGGATVFAYPSLEEGFGLPPLEAMACGTPVVSSTTSALGENLGGAALLVDPSDRGALADALLRVLRDEAEAARLRAAGLQRAGAFTWDECARGHASAYRAAAPAVRRRVAAADRHRSDGQQEVS